MKTLEKVSDFVGKYMAAIVIVVAAGALFFPGPFSVVKTAWVNNLLGIVMFGMGLTLKPEDFKVVFSRPKDVIIGCVAQFTLMPFLAWALTQVFHLPTELAIGVILVGTCPGGTSSNVMTYLSKGDVALSVGMTAVSTVLAPFLTPLLTLLYAGQRVDVNPMSMFMSIVKVVLVPIALGFVVNHFFHKFTEEAVRVLPLVSTTAIVLIICAVVSANSAKIMTSGLLILVVVILHNVLGTSPALAWASCSSWTPPSAARSPSRWACRTPALQPVWPPHTLHSIRWLPFPALCSPCGITFPVRSSPTSLPAQQRRRIDLS